MTRWTATIVYDSDSTHELTLTGHQVSSQLAPDGRCLVNVRNADGEVIEVFQASKTHTIHKKRVGE